MTILVIAEHDHASIKAATLNTVAAAAKIGGDIHVLVAGSNVQGAADAAAKIAGVAKVLLADAPQLADGLAENVEGTVLNIAKNYSPWQKCCSPMRPNSPMASPKTSKARC